MAQRPRPYDPDDFVLAKQRDPFFRRIGLLVAAIVLLVPLALILRPAEDGGTRLSTEVLPGAVALVQPSGADASASTSSSTVAEQAIPAFQPSSTIPAYSVPPTASVDAAVVEVATAPPATEAPTTAAPVVIETSPAAAKMTAPPVTEAPTTLAPLVCGQSHKVAAGDSWSGIAAAYGLRLSALLELNRAATSTAIYPGDKVCVPPGSQVRAAATTTAAPAATKAPSTTKAPTTTKVPATTAAPTTTVPTRKYSTDEVKQIIRDVWPDDLEEWALEIAFRESSYQPTAKNFCCYGLFQINWSSHKNWLDDFGVTSASQLFDPAVNAQMALALYNRSGGWGPWGG